MADSRRCFTIEEVTEMLDDSKEPITAGSDDEDVLWEEEFY